MSVEALTEEVRKYHIPNFSNWKNHAAFERASARFGARRSLRFTSHTPARQKISDAFFDPSGEAGAL